AEDALRDSERRFREMADTAPAMLWVTEPDGYCSFLSRGWYAFTGQTEAEGLGLGWTNAAHPDDRDAAREAFVAANRDRTYYEIDFRVRRADGEYRWVIDAGRPRFGPGGEFLGFIGSVIDIHDRKLAEAERNRLLDGERAARAEAERAGRMKDEFLATLSHELRTPLNAILGWAQILRADTDGTAPPADDLHQGLEVIERNARAQTRIIDDLLDMSRIIAGKVRLDVQPVALPPVIEAAVDTVRPAADAKGVRVHVALDPLAGHVSGDPGRLQQVFWNLLANSVKHTDRGGRVDVALARAGSHLEVSVTDTGEGIAPEFLPHVFDRFRQADGSTTRRHGGLGLGLSIVRHLTELHGGTVRAWSAGAGLGATFTVSLPLTAVHAGGDGQATDGKPRPARAGLSRAATMTGADGVDLTGVRVVVVDDEPDARTLVRRILEDCGAVVSTAASAREALAAVQGERPDALVSDVGMPGEDGYSLIRRVRALPAAEGGDVPAIALTAYARGEERTRALRAGFTGHIAKPVEPAELVATIAALARVRK
ncbi:MAG: ATP-binding protein, partial [Phycisphaerae bacterium]